MAASEVFILHSVTTSNGDSEGTPNVILEAAASGLVVISTMHAGIKDVITDGKNGLLVEERDIEGMAKCIMKVVKDRNLSSELSRNAQETVTQHYNLKTQILKLDSLIYEVCAV
jgi:colanic acid/amylovoran biosynthesis glycosyltransferase